MLHNTVRSGIALITAIAGAQTLPPINSANTCALPLALADVRHPTAVVGSGTPASCTEQALQAALNVGGIVTFNCGPSPATIPITTEHPFRKDADTVLDGGNKITLQGNGATRLFRAHSGRYQTTRTAVTIQNITIRNGRSSGPALPALPPGAPANCSHGTEFEGGGGFIYVQDMVLHVINSRFYNNHGPSLGPDVAGGAIYALGSLDVTVQGSTFQGNDASNGGALGSLQSNVTLVNNVFEDNRSVGLGGNYNIKASGCPLHLNQYQVGSGGNAGAVYFDGQADRGIVVCGNKFRRNAGTDALGGALWAAGDPGTINLTVAQSEFEQNRNSKGGAIYGYKAKAVVVTSTFVNNTAGYGGAVQTDNSQFISVNNTYSGNTASTSIGALALFGTSNGVILNSTFSGNSAPYFPILFPGDAGQPTPNIVLVNNLFSSNASTRYSIPCSSPLPGGNNTIWPPQSATASNESGCAAAIPVMPQLGPLADNGGGVLTMSIPAGNPAARIANTSCPATDERGVARGQICAAGAFEPK